MKEDGETLVVRVVDLEDKEALLRSDPDVFFTTPHYDGYAYVLVRLAARRPGDARRADRGRVAAVGAEARARRLRRRAVAEAEQRAGDRPGRARTTCPARCWVAEAPTALRARRRAVAGGDLDVALRGPARPVRAALAYGGH